MTTEQRITLNELIQYHLDHSVRKETMTLQGSMVPTFTPDALFHERVIELLEKCKPLGEGDKDALMLTVEKLAKAVNALLRKKPWHPHPVTVCPHCDCANGHHDEDCPVGEALERMEELGL